MKKTTNKNSKSKMLELQKAKKISLLGKTKNLIVLLAIVFVLFLSPSTLSAQEWSTGVDVYSSYIWRGLKFGEGPAFQPSVEFSQAGFSIGGWGSFSAGSVESPEADLYAGYEFAAGEKTTIGVMFTDYYFPGSDFFDGKSHYLEPALSVGFSDFSLLAAYMMYDGAGNGDDAGDVYLEAGYDFGPVSLTIGGGNGQYSMEDPGDDDTFAISNVGLGASKELKLTESYSLPVSGAVILNPSTKQFYVVVGISL